MPKKTAIRPEDIYEIRQPSVCRLSPAGDRLAVVVAQPNKDKLANTSQIWILDLRDELRGAAEAGSTQVRPFTQAKGSDFNPRWSPDGKSLAFVSARSGKAELWVIPADGGEARQVTELKGSISDFAWHPKGKRLVVAWTPQDAEAKEREAKRKKGEPGGEAPLVRHLTRIFYKLDGAGFIPKGRSHLFSVDLETGKAKPLTDDDRFDEGEPTFSPDGRWLYFVSNRTQPDPDLELQRVDLWRIPSKGGKIEKVKTFDGPSATPSPSRDGKWIAFLGKARADEPWNMRHDKLWVVPAAGGRGAQLAEKLDRACGNSTINDTFGFGTTPPVVWSPDSAWVYFVVTNEGNSELWRTHVRDRKPEPVWQRPGALLDFAIDFERSRVYATFADQRSPGELLSAALPKAGRRKDSIDAESAVDVRSSWNSWLESRQLALPQEFWFDGPSRNRLQGWILSPVGFNAKRKYPGMLYIHGGPATQYGRVYFHEFQVLAARGYVVIYTNPRGGTGYSERHLNSIVNRWGTHDYDDLMAFTDLALRKARHLDRSRLAVGGGSYGGFMTNWIIGHTNRFACAVSSRSISNLLSFVGSSDFGYFWPQEFGSKGPWEDPEHYLKMSPLSYLAKMKTPTLIEHQEEDHRCPIEQAEQLFSQLKMKGVPCEFLRYPGEPHGMSRSGRPDRRIHRLERITDWLGRWLKR